MKFRNARHTNNLAPVLAFYRDVLGLDLLDGFKDHNGYDGVFLGIAGVDWHLEFTVSDEPAQHTPDEDDLLVFYPNSESEYSAIVNRFAENSILPVAPKNPYWEGNGTTYCDPDGYRLVIARPRQ